MERLPHYSTDIMNTSTVSRPAPSATSTYPQQQQSRPSFQLDVLARQPSGGSYPYTPRTATTRTPRNNTTNYPPRFPQNSGRGAGDPAMGNNAYTLQYNPTTPVAMTASITTPSHPRPIAPAPSSGFDVDQAPGAGILTHADMNSPYGHNPLMLQQNILPDSD